MSHTTFVQGSTLALMLALLWGGACDDPGLPTEPTGPSDPALPPNAAAPLPQAIACRAGVATGVVACRSPTDDPVPGLSRVILGAQDTFVTLASDNVGYDGNTEIFQADITVQNLIAQALGTTDGTAVDPEGVRVFFHRGPIVPGGGGGIVTVANASGTATFIETEQPYFQYDEMLETGDISSPLTWQWNVPVTVDSFEFDVYVAAQVQYPDGWVDVSPESPVVGIGLKETLTASVLDELGRMASSQSVTWSSTAPSTAEVDPTTGEVTGIAEGTTTVCASSPGPEADGCVTVTVKPVVVVRSLAAPQSPSVGGTSDITLQLDVTQIPEPVTSAVGDVTWNASLLDYLDDAAGTIWDLFLSNETPAGTLRFSAVSASGVTGDVLTALTFSVEGLATGCTELVPTLTELKAIDPVTFEAIDLLHRALIVTEPVTVCVGQGGTIALGDTIYGAIQPTGDVDEFTFSATVGQEVVVFLQGLSGDAAYNQRLALELLDQAGTVDEVRLGDEVVSYGDAATLTGDGRSTGQVALPRTDTYTVRVRGTNATLTVGAYRFWLHGVDRAPESVSASVVVGDTIVGELVDPPGDIDEFTFSATVGQEVVVFLQGLSGDAAYNQRLALELLDQAGTVDEVRLGNEVVSYGNAATLTGDGRSTGQVALPRTDTYTVRVRGIDDRWADGAYRVWLHGVDRAPESVSASVVVGDTIVGELVDPPGDIDEFTFSATVGQEVVVFLQGLSGDAAYNQRLALELLDQAGTVNEMRLGDEVVSYGDAATLTGDGRSTGQVALPRTDTYTVRVRGIDDRWADGAYRVWLHGVDRAPESVSASVVVGDTIVGELVDPPGDIDEFTFSATVGQEVVVFLQGLSGDAAYNQRLALELLDQAGTVNEMRLGDEVVSYGDAATLTGDGRSTGQVALPRTDTYTVRVRGIDDRWADGAYRVWLHGVDRAPESVSASVVVGDTIVGELVHPPGDIDEFTFSATVGQEVVVFLQGLSGDAAYNQRLALELLDQAGTVDEVRLGDEVVSYGDAATLTGDGRSTGQVALPRTDTYTVRVRGIDDRWADGAYRVWLHGVDRAPESVSASVVVGDTIVGELVDPPGDIDEFTFSATVGQEVVVFLQGLSGDAAYNQRLALELLDQAGTVDEVRLGNEVVSYGNASTLEDQSTGSVTLPRTGTYTVRVQGFNDDVAQGAYRFEVRAL